MKDISELISDIQLKRQERKSTDRLIKGLKQAILPNSQVTINSAKVLLDSVLSALEQSQKENQEITATFIKALKSIEEKIGSIEVNVPDINIPDIKLDGSKIRVPEPRVNVKVDSPKIPPINVPEAKVTVVVEREDLPHKVTPYRDKFGVIQKVVEDYKTGQVISERKDGVWTINDKRKRLS